MPFDRAGLAKLEKMMPLLAVGAVGVGLLLYVKSSGGKSANDVLGKPPDLAGTGTGGQVLVDNSVWNSSLEKFRQEIEAQLSDMYAQQNANNWWTPPPEPAPTPSPEPTPGPLPRPGPPRTNPDGVQDSAHRVARTQSQMGMY